MQIKDLALPVVAAKADWLPGTHWMGFTPRDGSVTARAQCRSTVYSQFQGGYVIEYVTRYFGDPNPGFENDPRHLAEKAVHKDAAGKLIAVHRLRPTARPLREILGEEEFEHLQDRWAASGKRHRWQWVTGSDDAALIDPDAGKVLAYVWDDGCGKYHPQVTVSARQAAQLMTREAAQLVSLRCFPRVTVELFRIKADELAEAQRRVEVVLGDFT